MIPLGLKQNVPWAHSRNPQYHGYSHDTVSVIVGFNQYCTGLLFCIHYPVFLSCIHSAFCPFCFFFCSSVLPLIRLFDLFCSCRFALFDYSVFGYYSVFNYSIYSVLFSVLILELYSRYFNPVNTVEVTCYHHQPSSKSINIIKYKTCTWFWLGIGVQRPIAIIVMSRDIRNQFLRLGSRRARHSPSSAPVGEIGSVYPS
jgi:hypothetical protein